MLLLHYEDFGKYIAENCPHAWINNQSISGRLLNRFLAEFGENQWPGRNHLDGLFETDEERAAVASILFETPKGIDDPVRHINQGIHLLRTRAAQKRIREIELLQTNADSVPVDYGALAIERAKLQKVIRGY